MNKFANVLSLVDFVLSLLAHTEDCDRGFSMMKYTKKDWPNCLNDDRLTLLMQIQLDSSSIGEFDPTPAIKLWFHHAERKHRPFQPPYKKCAVGLQYEDVTNCDSSGSSDE
ncbi:hypothetical protein PR048_001920 [Dryococelus australis]|uniref:HAT C-terminal dimerisation domain-containing protein n=1 Tax=Dryococelus australis TaxID=614101 RepID=A0ABQ9IIW5_9NEOP|nr:hypothetical protein PR048_001920 [Dryococelus australis]